LEKAKFNHSCGVFLKIVKLAAIICIVCFLADVARSVRNLSNPNEHGKSNISKEAGTKSESPIILLSSTIAEVESTVPEVESKDSFVSNEAEIKVEAQPQKVEKIQIIPEDEVKQQPEDSGSNADVNIESNSNPETESNAEKSKTKRYIELPGEWEIIQMRVTAYCPCPSCCGEYSDGITANGYEIQPGDTFVAADRRYPFHTEMLIPGYSNSQPVKVLDRGGAIKGNWLDVFFATHEEALQWGVQYLEVNVRRENL